MCSARREEAGANGRDNGTFPRRTDPHTTTPSDRNQSHAYQQQPIAIYTIPTQNNTERSKPKPCVPAAAAHRAIYMYDTLNRHNLDVPCLNARRKRGRQQSCTLLRKTLSSRLSERRLLAAKEAPAPAWPSILKQVSKIKLRCRFVGSEDSVHDEVGRKSGLLVVHHYLIVVKVRSHLKPGQSVTSAGRRGQRAGEGERQECALKNERS